MTCEINQAAPLPCCASSLKIGKFATAKSGAYAIFKNLATDNQIVKQFNSEGDGSIVIDVSDISFPTDQPYQIYFQNKSGYQDMIPFTVGGSSEMLFIRTLFFMTQKADGSEFEIIQGEAVLE